MFFCPNRVHSPLQRMFKAMFTEERASFDGKHHSVDGAFNNQSMAVTLVAPAGDYDLYVERQSRVSGAWSPAGQSATGSASETATLGRPLPGHYRARVVNWAAAGPAGLG